MINSMKNPSPTTQGTACHLQQIGLVLHVQMQQPLIGSVRPIFLFLLCKLSYVHAELAIASFIANNQKIMGKWNHDNVRSASDH